MCLEVAAHESYNSGAEHSPTGHSHLHSAAQWPAWSTQLAAPGREDQQNWPGTSNEILEAPCKASQRHSATAAQSRSPTKLIHASWDIRSLSTRDNPLAQVRDSAIHRDAPNDFAGRKGCPSWSQSSNRPRWAWSTVNWKHDSRRHDCSENMWMTLWNCIAFRGQVNTGLSFWICSMTKNWEWCNAADLDGLGLSPTENLTKLAAEKKGTMGRSTCNLFGLLRITRRVGRKPVATALLAALPAL